MTIERVEDYRACAWRTIERVEDWGVWRTIERVWDYRACGGLWGVWGSVGRVPMLACVAVIDCH